MDEDITALLEAGRHRPAFELALARYQGKVFRLAVSVLRNEGLAEEATQDAFVRIWNALPRYDASKGALSTWIYAIARNTCITALRKAPSPHAPVEAAEAMGTAGDPYAARLEVQAVLARLPENHRRVLTLFYMENKSYTEVAEMLGLPMGTLKTQLHRAKRAAAALLNERVRPEPASDERGTQWIAGASRI